MQELARLDSLRLIPREISPASIAATREVFARLHGEPDHGNISVERDISYGAHARQRLDVFRPAELPARRRPVIMFVHGGGFVAGDKSSGDGLFFGNIGIWAVRSGFIGVNITYRLAPESCWPAAKQDVAAAIGWVRANIDRYGGDPRGIILMGHSAGATHVATCLADLDAPALTHVRHTVLVSGIYHLFGPQMSDGEIAYFGNRPDRFPDGFPITDVARAPTPLLIAVSELDPTSFHEQALRLVAARQAQAHPGATRLLFLAGHNHFSPMLHFNLRPEGELENAIGILGRNLAAAADA
jgi:acetyl esterase/lipase